MQQPAIPKGTRDFSPQMMAKRNYLFSVIKKAFVKYGFLPLETPCMENLSTLTGKYGEEGDQLIFKILNSGDFLKKTSETDYNSGSKALTSMIAEKGLRYDLTVPFARYIVKNKSQITFPFKRYQIQPVWRADRPQKGRYREFYQCDADVIGTNSLLCEMEIVQMINEVFEGLNFADYTIKINNRKILTGIAEHLGQPGKETELCVAIDKLDKVDQDQVFSELKSNGFEEGGLKVLDEIFSIVGTNQEKLDRLGQLIGNEICLDGITELREVFNHLSASKSYENSRLEFDVSLARGLSYYTGCIFEVKPTTVKMGTISAGGRYDDLTGLFGLNDVSGVGISFGIDRIYDVLDELNLFPKETIQSTEVLLVNFGVDTLPDNLKILRELRGADIRSEIYPEMTKMKKQFNYADKKSIPFVLMAGEDEIKNGLFSLKNMMTGEQGMLSVKQIVQKITNQRQP